MSSRQLALSGSSHAPLELRHYQRKAVDALWNFLCEKSGNPLVVLPTGTGKSLVIAEFLRMVISQYPKIRILVLTHSKELVGQNFQEAIEYWPQCPAGVNNAGLGKRDVKSQVIFGSIQSVYKSAFALQQVDIIIVDEAHSIPRNSQTMWNTFFATVGKINDHLRVCGLTATDYRMDSGRLTDGEDAMFDDVVYEYSILEAIEDGYLSMPVSVSSATQIDTDNVGTRGGEFIQGQLEAAAIDPATVEAIADEICEKGKDRHCWIVFGAGVKHCNMLRDAIRARGYTAEGVYAVTPKDERDRFIARFKAGMIRCLLSVNALTTGFNVKQVDLVGLARPTKSTGLYIQACGRGTRPVYPPGFDLSAREGRLAAMAAGPKRDCLILDFGGNINRHGFLDQPNVKKPGKGGGEMPVKLCKLCFAPNYIAARECSTCGAPFDVEGTKVSVKPIEAPLLSSQQAAPEWVEVDSVSYARHEKLNNPTSMRVTYLCGLISHAEWIHFERMGGQRTRAENWWRQRTGGSAPPGTVAEALARKNELRQPTQIEVRPQPGGKFVDIVNARFM